MGFNMNSLGAAFLCMQIDERALGLQMPSVELMKAVKLYAENKAFFERVVTEFSEMGVDLEEATSIIEEVNNEMGTISPSDIKGADKLMIELSA